MAKQTDNYEALAQLFHILGDRTRLRILMALQSGKLNVTQLCKALKAPQPTVSRHLGIMRMAGLLVNRRNGKEIFYRLSDAPGPGSARSLRSLLDSARALCPERAGRH